MSKNSGTPARSGARAGSIEFTLTMSDGGVWKTRIAEPEPAKGYLRWHGDEAARRAVYANRARLTSGIGGETMRRRGATDAQLMAIFGWSKAEMAAHYRRAANQKTLAESALHLLTREQTPPAKSPTAPSIVSHFAETPIKSAAYLPSGGPGGTRTPNQTVMSGRL